jgi:hypothetical protein
MARSGQLPLRLENFSEIPKKSIAAYRPSPVRFSRSTFKSAHNGPDKAGARQQKEVIAVVNNIVSFSQHAGFGMPVSGRARVSSLRAFPMTAAVSPAAGQKCVLSGSTSVIDGYRLVTGASVATGAFPGLPAWSPPI